MAELSYKICGKTTGINGAFMYNIKDTNVAIG